MKRAYKRFSKNTARSKYFYARCGRKRWKMTKEVQDFLVRRLLQLRKKVVVTSITLQSMLANELNMRISDSAIRKLLVKKGFKWLPRAQKRKYDKEDLKKRLFFVTPVNAMSRPAVRRKMAFAMDGVILSCPPTDPVLRLNHCMGGETHMWRKPGETADPELAGQDNMTKQVPLSRAIPLWGGISEGGFAEVLVHPNKKLTQAEWTAAVRSGKLTGAIRKLKPELPKGPWHVICDNEKFLHANESKKAYAARPLKMWHIPPRSPDLMPLDYSLWNEVESRTLDKKGHEEEPLASYKKRLNLTAKRLPRKLVQDTFDKLAAIVKSEGGPGTLE